MKHTHLDSYEVQEANHKMKIAEKINNLAMEWFDVLLVTCWMCWWILNQLMHQEESNWDIACPYCKFIWEPSDFPDLFY